VGFTAETTTTRVEGAEIDGGPQDDGLIERRAAALDVGHRADRNAGVKRSAFAGHYDVADTQRRILLDVVVDDACEVSACDSPPSPPSHDRRYAAGIIRDEDDRTGERSHGNDAADHASGREDAFVRPNSRNEPLSIVTARDSFSGGNPMTRASVPR